MRDWDAHTAEVEGPDIALLETVPALLIPMEEGIEKLAKASPLAALRAARRLEVTAMQVGYWSARAARQDATTGQAAALG
ncbi:hypothetical protein [Streptomyces sioyaensis]|uniref:hypothetical protein n=1 Tax=Streptomyces sioyaensis TaxID=67364 RepID=UPI0036DFFCE6